MSSAETVGLTGERPTTLTFAVLGVSYLAPQRGLFTSPVGFLSHYSIKHQLDARLPTVQSSLPVTSLLTPLIPLHVRPARRHASPAHRLLVCTLVLSVLSFLIMEPPGGNLFPIADSDLSITCEIPPASSSPSHFEKLSSPLLHASRRRIPPVPL